MSIRARIDENRRLRRLRREVEEENRREVARLTFVNEFAPLAIRLGIRERDARRFANELFVEDIPPAHHISAAFVAATLNVRDRMMGAPE